MGDEIQLADAVEAVRNGLLEAATRAAASEIRFELGEINMEFTVEIRRDVRAKGGVKAWVIDAGAEGSAAKARTHKVSFSLKPKSATTGQDWLIAAEDEGDLGGFTAADRS